MQCNRLVDASNQRLDFSFEILDHGKLIKCLAAASFLVL